MRRPLIFILMCLAVGAAMAQTTFTHPWSGKKVAYFGDSITDPNNKASDTKYLRYNSSSDSIRFNTFSFIEVSFPTFRTLHNADIHSSNHNRTLLQPEIHS